MPGPSDAVMAIANRMGGNAMVRSTSRISTASSQPPKKPEMAPMIVPTMTEATITIAATGNEMRAPHNARVNTSRPSASVPIRCVQLGDSSRASPCSSGSYGVHSGRVIATITHAASIANPAIAAPLSHAGRRRRRRAGDGHRSEETEAVMTA